MTTVLATPADVDANAVALEQFTDDWGPSYLSGATMDWEGFVDRLERNLDWDLPTDWTSPVFRRLKKVVRQALREAGELD